MAAAGAIVSAKAIGEGRQEMRETARHDPPSYRAMGLPRFRGVNWRGTWTLYLKEVQRFLKVFLQTIAAPIVSTLLFLAIFSFALGSLRPEINGVAFGEFLAPGLMMMAIMQNAFANTSSSILIAKIQGNIVDYLMPPLSPGEINSALALSGMTRGLLVAFVTGLAMTPFLDLRIAIPSLVIFHAMGAALMLSLLGTLTAIWAEKFDHLASITNFVILPLSFLSGTFYSARHLPELAQSVIACNPLFYVIDGFRAGFLGRGDAPYEIGILIVLLLNAILWTVCHGVLRQGWRLKT